MTNYKIIEVDIDDKRVLTQVNKLLNAVFGNITEHKLKLNTTTNNSQKSLYLAAVENDIIIGFNAFISHAFSINGILVNGYQSCWTATDINHRGKKIFQNIINVAKKMLVDRNAAFIFGFPNENSRSIFLNNLGFREYSSLKLNMINFHCIRKVFLNTMPISFVHLNKNSIIPCNQELYDLKKSEYGKQLMKIESNNNYIWGLVRVRVFKGIKVSYFDLGGFEISNIEDLSAILIKLSKLTKVLYIQLIVPESNTYNKLFKLLKPACTNNLIVYDLSIDTSSFNFNFFGGVKDVY